MLRKQIQQTHQPADTDQVYTRLLCNAKYCLHLCLIYMYSTLQDQSLKSISQCIVSHRHRSAVTDPRFVINSKVKDI